MILNNQPAQEHAECEEELKAEERKDVIKVVGKEEAKSALQEAYCDQLLEQLAVNAELRYQRD